MPTFRPKTGWLLVLPDPDEHRTRSGVLFADSLRRKRTSGICILHQASPRWLAVEPAADGWRVLFEKWAWRKINLSGEELWLVPEQAVFALLDTSEGDPLMNRKELLDSLIDSVRDIVNGELLTDTDELTEESAAAIDGQLETLATEALTLESEEDTEEAEDK